ncbi:MAG TPA: fumarylacetoacetate hydrolase family protein [Acidobacteriaceae bacterium]|nr:fumarylacetoacetate hydrolase family protein [Acidobacteriaceae bacterium]
MDHQQTASLSGTDRERLQQAANVLLEARRTVQPIDNLPASLSPQSLQEAYYVQDAIMAALGKVGGWKVGAPSPEATPLFAPMPLNGFARNGDVIAPEFRRLRGVEAEIAFLMGKDLPPRSKPYSREEVTDAIARCCPAIELLESGVLNPDSADRLTAIADLQSNGGFVPGEAIGDWQSFDFANESAEINVDGFVRVAGGKNSAGSDVLRLVQWLANLGQERTGGLAAGQWVTTGSWTGKTMADSGSTVIARFPQLGEVRIRFA